MSVYTALTSEVSYWKDGIRQATKGDDRKLHAIPTSNKQIIEILNEIKNGAYKDRIEVLRKLQGEPYKEYKDKLPYVTFSGTFSERHSQHLIQHSGWMILDFDHLENVQWSKEKLSGDSFVHAIFISPGGNGLKTLHRINPEQHAGAFKFLEKHFHEEYELKVDPSGKDVTRACYLSWDGDLRIFEERLIVDSTDAQEDTETLPAISSPEEIPDHVWNKSIAFAERLVGPYGPRNHNNVVYRVACHLNRYGIPELIAADACLANFVDITEKELRKSVNSAYKHHVFEFGKYQAKKLTDDNGANRTDTTSTEKKYEETCIYNGATEQRFIGEFWKRTLYYDDERNVKDVKVSCEYVKLAEFFAAHGYARLKIPKTTGSYTFQFVRVVDNVITVIDPNQNNVLITVFKDFAFDWMKQNNVPHDVEEAFTRGSKNYFSSNVLDRLPLMTFKMKRDTRDEAFYYFLNCWVKVTAFAIETYEYSSLDAPIWRSQIIDREFHLPKNTDTGVFSKFVWLAATGNELVEKRTPLQISKHVTLCTGIGYMLHSYKNPAQAVAFNIFDAKITYNKEAAGGSGKSLIFQALSKIKPMVKLDGKRDDIRKPETFADVNIDTAIVFIDDVIKNFHFDTLFYMITGEMKVKKLYLDSFSIPFKDAPKIGITSNYTLKGDGNAYDRRQFNATLTDFFNKDNTPQIYFGKSIQPANNTESNGEAPKPIIQPHLFFEDWDPEEWQRFDLFMLGCVQQFLAEGLHQTVDSDYKLKKLLDDIDYRFYDFMEEQPRNLDLDRKKMYEEFKRQHEPDFDKMSVQKFTDSLCKYSTFKNIVINPGVPITGKLPFGMRHSGNVYFIYLDNTNETVLTPDEPAQTPMQDPQNSVSNASSASTPIKKLPF